jgi:hypothetical protein
MNYDAKTIGRGCALQGLSEISDLQIGMDFRKIEYRREVFLRFYEFHLKYKAHPGGVYYLLPYLMKQGMHAEQVLWMAFINGCCQHLPTTYYIMKKFPTLEGVNFSELETWFNAHWKQMGWDMDRRYVKAKFVECVKCYKNLVDAAGGQVDLFSGILCHNTLFQNFTSAWHFVMENFKYFGRLSTFSYLEYLKILGFALDCDSLFLEDIHGSKSHRNGLCKVLGRDDLDWHHTNPEFDGVYNSPVMEWLNNEAVLLLAQAQSRMTGTPYHKDISYFTLESTLCAFKSWFRPNRRYPNVYNDMLHQRLIKAQEAAPEFDYGLFWEARQKALPKYLRVEDNFMDPGLSKVKQNYFRETGCVPMMSRDFPCFACQLDRDIGL